MSSTGEIKRRIDAPPDEVTSCANDKALDILAAAVKVMIEEEPEVDGVPIEDLIAEEVGIKKPGSEEARSEILRNLYIVRAPLKTAIKIDYIRPDSTFLDDNTAA